VRAAYRRALDDATGERDGKQRLQALIEELEAAGYTAVAKCLADDLDALVVHLRYPTRHRRRWRNTNLLERSLAEVKRRTKVIGRFRGETSCLTLVWAVLDLYITHAKNGVRFSQLERRRLRRMRCIGRFAGISGRSARRGYCLPCRRSWVRIPSAALSDQALQSLIRRLGGPAGRGPASRFPGWVPIPSRPE
jgi:hypothetical protein